MNKDLKAIIGVFALGLAAMASCKKSSSSPSPASTLEGGTWTISKEYVDTNNNRIMDPSELLTDSSIAHRYFKFNSDGTVTSTYYGTVEQSTWALVNNNTYIKITDTGAFGTTVYDSIITLTSNSFAIKDTINAANGGTDWIYFTK